MSVPPLLDIPLPEYTYNNRYLRGGKGGHFGTKVIKMSKFSRRSIKFI
jgi:hypothetical protein